MSDKPGNNGNNNNNNNNNNDNDEVIYFNDKDDDSDNSGDSVGAQAAGKGWMDSFPGPADRNFDYRKLLEESPEGIGKAAESNLKVAIIGAGPAGLCAAHELVRSGLKDVHLFEASDRYGGRIWTKTLADDKGEKQYSAMDAGAMRMPPFIPDKDKKTGLNGEERQKQIWAGRSILAYYLDKFKISTDEFPNPGSAVAKSGIYYNEGSFLPANTKDGNDNDEKDNDDDDEKKSELKNSDYKEYNKYAKGQMLIWNKEDDLPPNEKLQKVQKKWSEYRENIKKYLRKYYATEDWPAFWRNVVRHYYDKTFRDVVFLAPVDDVGENLKGNFGGLGMDEEEARIFFVIGAGDGGWGSFYNLSFLFVYRTLIHGYGNDLQVIEGLFDKDGNRREGPYEGYAVFDSLGSEIVSPKYLGTATIPECLLFGPLGSPHKPSESLYTSMSIGGEPGFNCFFNSPVSRIKKLSNGKIKLQVKSGNDKNYGYEFDDVEYDAVIITVPTHQIGTEIEVTGFDTDTEWPYDLQNYLYQAHWMPCAKVFVELTEPYWEDPDCTIPQVIESETFIRDTYGVKINKGKGGTQTGVLLLSYTWWRDATKLVAYDDQELINLAVKEADRMLGNCKNIKIADRISAYAKHTKDKFGNINYKGWVHRWELQKHYKGAARLYDQRTWRNTYLPMIYNQVYSETSKLYFAGEGYHVDAGWTEPALRTAIDSVLRIFVNNEVEIRTSKFFFDRDYPAYETGFDPKTQIEDLPSVAKFLK